MYTLYTIYHGKKRSPNSLSPVVATYNYVLAMTYLERLQGDLGKNDYLLLEESANGSWERVYDSRKHVFKNDCGRYSIVGK